jgi:hypothetical protein
VVGRCLADGHGLPVGNHGALTRWPRTVSNIRRGGATGTAVLPLSMGHIGRGSLVCRRVEFSGLSPSVSAGRRPRVRLVACACVFGLAGGQGVSPS